MAGSSSSLPSSGEANPYPYPSHVSAPNFVTVKLSGRDTYYVWQMQMRCLLQSHDMLAFISSQSHALGKEKVGDDDMLWRRSDALVKGWILGSLSQQTLENVVKQIPKKDFTAIEVWDKLQSLYGPPAVQDDAAAEGGDFVCEIEKLIKKMLELEDLEEVKKAEAKKIRLAEKLHAAILHQHFWVVERILDDKIVTLRDKITINDNTALHVAVGTSSNNKEFFEKMLNLATKDNEQSLDMRNSEGSTLLHVAAIVGNTEAAKILVERNKDLLYVKDNEERTPVDRALSNMHSDTFIYLLDNYLKFQDVEKGDLVDSTEILVNAISSKDYDSAYKMIRFMRDPEPVLMAIAQNFPPKVNFLESMLLQVKRCMTLLFSHVPAMFKFVEAAQRKAEAYRNAKLLVRITCDLMIRASTTTSTTFNDVIFEATKQNAVKVVKIIVSQFPNAILGNNEDDHNIIQYAVINRSEKVYNLLYQMREHKNIYRTIKDPYENNLLHLAARLAPKNKLNPISGAALQLQRELQWFKEVERFVCPLNVIEKNYFEKTPQMVFAKEHKKLLIEGEKWMKETAQSYTITAALITTIVFAAAITVPGGNKQENGIPVFTNNVAFNVFAISDAISFFTSVTSLLMFLSILTARFSEKDFLFKLPTKLIIGLVNLFISTTAMLVAFGATLFLVFGQKNSWIVGPIAALTCLPIASFIFLQFPLIYDLISATYGRSMFGKRSNAPLIY